MKTKEQIQHAILMSGLPVAVYQFRFETPGKHEQYSHWFDCTEEEWETLSVYDNYGYQFRTLYEF